MTQKICPSVKSTIDLQRQNDKLNQGKQCRICLDETYPLITACKCTGTVKYVHEVCLIQWAQEIVKKRLKQMQQDCDYKTVTSIECQLCKQEINLQIEWTDRMLTFNEARKRNEDYFLPILIVNVLIGLICAGCLGLAVAILIMVLTENPVIDYERFKNDPYVTWGTLSGSIVVGLIFFYKSCTEIYSIFIKKQFNIKGVVYKEVLLSQQGKVAENFQPYIRNIQSFSDVKINMQRHIELRLPSFKQKQQSSNSNADVPQEISDVNLIPFPKQESKTQIKVLSPQQVDNKS